MRREDWPERLLEEIDRHEALPLAWGQADCFLFPLDCVKAMTGEDHAEVARGTYDTLESGLALLHERGFANVGDAFASLFPEIPIAMAGRGDLGVIERPDATMPVVFIDSGAMGKSDAGGLRRVGRPLVTRAFKVE